MDFDVWHFVPPLEAIVMSSLIILGMFFHSSGSLVMLSFLLVITSFWWLFILFAGCILFRSSMSLVSYLFRYLTTSEHLFLHQSYDYSQVSSSSGHLKYISILWLSCYFLVDYHYFDVSYVNLNLCFHWYVKNSLQFLLLELLSLWCGQHIRLHTVLQ